MFALVGDFVWARSFGTSLFLNHFIRRPNLAEINVKNICYHGVKFRNALRGLLCALGRLVLAASELLEVGLFSVGAFATATFKCASWNGGCVAFYGLHVYMVQSTWQCLHCAVFMVQSTTSSPHRIVYIVQSTHSAVCLRWTIFSEKLLSLKWSRCISCCQRDLRCQMRWSGKYWRRDVHSMHCIHHSIRWFKGI